MYAWNGLSWKKKLIDLAHNLNEKLINEIQVLKVFKLKIRNKKIDVSHILGNSDSLSNSANCHLPVRSG